MSRGLSVKRLALVNTVHWTATILILKILKIFESILKYLYPLKTQNQQITSTGRTLQVIAIATILVEVLFLYGVIEENIYLVVAYLILLLLNLGYISFLIHVHHLSRFILVWPFLITVLAAFYCRDLWKLWKMKWRLKQLKKSVDLNRNSVAIVWNE